MQGGILQEKRDSDGWNALILLRICTEFVPVTPFNEGILQQQKAQFIKINCRIELKYYQ